MTARSCLISSLQPIPLDLLTLVNYNDPPTQRGAGLLRGLRGGHGEAATPNTPGASPDTVNDSRYVYPVTLHHNGRMGGAYLLYAESQQARMEWKTKLDEALVLRRVVQDSNKVFEIETLSAETFLLPSFIGAQNQPWNQEIFTGKVSCSVPFSKPPECTKKNSADAGRKPPLMGVRWSQLDARKASGSASDMIQVASAIFICIEELY